MQKLRRNKVITIAREMWGIFVHDVDLASGDSCARSSTNCWRVSSWSYAYEVISYDVFERAIKIKDNCAIRMQLARAESKGKVRMTKNTLVTGILFDC